MALGTFNLPGEAEPVALIAMAATANPAPRYRSLEDTFYSDIRPATPEAAATEEPREKGRRSGVLHGRASPGRRG